MITRGLRLRLNLFIAALLLAVTLPVSAALDENCVINILNRTIQVAPNGTWTLPNVPSSQGRIRARATCVLPDGSTQSGQSDYFTVSNNGITRVPDITFDIASPIPSELNFFFTDPISFSNAGETFQLTINATYPDGSFLNVTASESGINYASSNSAIASVSANGLITAATSGVALINARKDGVLISRRVTVNTTGDLDSDGLPDDYETTNGLNPNDPVDAFEDVDGDGLSALDEYNNGTDIHKADTDGDGINDGEEIIAGADGYVTNALLADSDGDGLNDGVEVTVSSDPNDPNDTNFAAAVIDLRVTPSSVSITFNTINSENSSQLKVEGVLVDGSAIDLTAKASGTAYSSSDLSIVSFSAVDGEIFAGATGNATVTVTYQALNKVVPVDVQTFVPVALSALTIPGYANNVDVVGDTAFVAAGDAGLQVVDVTDRANPSIIGSLDTAGVAIDIKAVGNQVYIADGENGLVIVDVSTVASPVLMATLDTAGVAQDLQVEGVYAYVADGNGGISIININDPTNPILISELQIGSEIVKSVGVSGDRLALVTASALKMVDITDRTSPVLLGSVNISNTKDVVLDGNFAFVAAYSTGYRVVDVTDPNAPNIIGGDRSFVPRDVVLTDGFAFFAEQLFPNVTAFVNTTDAYNAFFQGTVDMSGLGDYAGTGIALDSGYAYVTEESYVVRSDYGTSGNTKLFIAQYRQLVDGQGLAPLVTVLAPEQGDVLVQGQPATISVDAIDDVAVVSVTFFIDGVAVFTDTTRPYQYGFTVPASGTAMAVKATAIDLGSNLGTSTTINVAIQPDGDGDGLGDQEETATYSTNPNNPDSDGDGLNDGDEIKFGTDPNVKDTDGDGLWDSVEVGQDTDPLNPDVTPPQVSTSTPANAATDIPENQIVSVIFDEPLLRRSINSNSMKVLLNGVTAAPGVVQLHPNNTELLFNPTGLMADFSDYVIEITGVKDAAGNPIVGTVQIGFTTGNLVDVEKPTIADVTPAHNLTGVPINATVVAIMSEPVDPATVIDANVYMYDYDGYQKIPGLVSLSADKTTISFVPDIALLVGRRHYLHLSAGVTDLFGNTLNAVSTWFTTSFDADGEAPQLVGTSIADGATDIPLNARIRVRFDEPLNGLSIRNIKLRTGGGDVLVTYALEADRKTIMMTPVAPLAASTAYEVFIDRLEDMSGNILPSSTTLNFTTGTVSDTVKGTIPSMTFKDAIEGVPLNAQLEIRLDERVDPLSLNTSSFWVYDDTYDKVIPGTFSLSEGNTRITFTPAAPLEIRHVYWLRASYYEKLYDLAGNEFTYRYYDNFTSGTEAVTTVPVLAQSSFPNAATGVPINARMALTFDGLISPLCLSTATAQATDGGNTFDFDIVLQDDGRSLILTAQAGPLAVSTSYTATVSGLCDYVGNTLAPVVLTFTTSADAADTVYPRVSTISPAHQATSVSANTSIVITYDENIDATDIGRIAVTVDGFSGNVAGNFVVAGNTVTFTPLNPFPGDSRIWVYTRYLRDLVGNNGYYTGHFYFDTAPNLDVTPPTVLAVSPVAAAVDVSPYASVVLTFNESLNSATVNDNTFVFWSNGALIRPTVLRSADNRTITLQAALPSGSPVALVVTDDVKDLSGNAMADFSHVFTTAVIDNDTVRPSVVRQYPTIGVRVQPQRIVLLTNEPMDTATLQGAFHVAENGIAVAGTLTLASDGQAIHFVPTNPLNPASYVQVYLESTATDTSGNALYNYSSHFYTPVDLAGTNPSPEAYNPLDGQQDVALNPQIQIKYTEALDPTTVNDTNVRFYKGDGAQLPASVSLSADGKVITVVPGAPLELDTRYYTRLTDVFDTDGDPSYNYYYPDFYTGASAVTDTRRPMVTSMTPATGASAVPLNARYLVNFDEAINPISFPVAEGIEVVFSSENRQVRYLPSGFLLPVSASITEQVPAVSDPSGNVVMPYSVTFDSAAAVDTLRPGIQSTSPVTNAVDVEVNGLIRVITTKAVDPLTVTSETFYLYDRDESNARVAATLAVSADGKTLTLVPDAVLKTGRSYTFLLRTGITDQAGNAFSGNNVYFTTSFETDNAAPTVELTSLENGQTNVPTNAQLRVRFSEPVDAVKAELDSQLVIKDGSGTVVPGRLSFNATRTEATLVPMQLFMPASSYSLTVSQVQDRAGNVLAQNTVIGFTTGAGVDAVSGSVLSLSFTDAETRAPLNPVLRVRLNERVDPLSLNTSTFWVYDDTIDRLVPGSMVLSEANTVITFTPDTPLQIGHVYYLRVSYYEKLKDHAGLDFNYRYYDNFSTVDFTAASAPTLEISNFQSGATGLPINARVLLRLQQPLSPFCVADAITTLTGGGTTVTYSHALQDDNRTLILTQSGLLAPSTSYTVTTSGHCDYAGNAIAPIVLSFTTSATATADTEYPRVSSISPAHQSTAVSASSVIVVTFDEVVDPSSAMDMAVSVDGLTGNVAGNWVVNGAVATFTPLNPFPGESRIKVYARYVRDLVGNNGYYTGEFYFDTAPRLDVTAPHVTAVSPADGSVDVSPYSPIVLTLNESLNANTVNNYNFVLWSNGVLIRPTVTRSVDNRTITLKATLPHGSPVAVVMTDDVTDLSGNAATDFISMFTTGVHTYDNTRPSIVSQYPANYTTVNTSKIVMYINEPMIPSTLSAAFHVTENGTLLTGSVVIGADGKSIEFTPTTPFTPGARIYVHLESTATDLLGNAIYAHKQYFIVPDGDAGIGDRPSPTTYSPRYNETEVALNPQIEVLFDEALDPAYVDGTTVTFHLSDGTELAATVSLSANGRIITIAPTALLTVDSRYYVRLRYTIQDTDGDNLYYDYYTYFNTGAAAIEDTQAPTVTAFSPANGSTNVPLNTVYHAHFDERVSPLSFPLDSRLNVAFSSDDRHVTYLPASVWLTPSTPVTETLPNLHDYSGNAIAPTSSTFTTGTGVTFDRPNSIMHSPAAETIVPINAVFEVLMDRPIDPASVTADTFYVYDTVDNVKLAATISVSADSRRLTLTPSADLPVNRRLYYTLRYIKDQANNQSTYYNWYFDSAAAADSGTPAVAQVSVADGSTGIPSDANLAVLMDEPINAVCMGRATISLTDGVDPITLNRTLSLTNRMLLVPDTPLKANTAYTLNISGLCNYMGVVLADQTITFTTAGVGVMDAVHPYVMYSTPFHGATDVPHNTRIELRVSERLDASTVTVDTLFLYDVTNLVIIPATISLSADLRTIQVVPQEALKASTKYRLHAYANNNSNLRPMDLAGLRLWSSPTSDYYGYLDDYDFTTGATVTDSTAPASTFVTLPDGVTGVPLNARFQIRMDEPLADACLRPDSLYFQEVSTTDKILGTYSFSADRYLLTYMLPAGTKLKASTSYQVLSGTALCDFANNTFAYAGSTFTTGAGPDIDTLHPYMAAVTPYDAATDVPLNSAIELRITEMLDPTTVSATTFQLRDTTDDVDVAISVSLSTDLRTVRLVPQTALTASHDYQIKAFNINDSNVRAHDLAGNIMWASAGSSYYGYMDDNNFTTGTTSDSTAPTIEQISPANGLTNVPLNAQFSLQIDERLGDACAHENAVYLQKVGTTDKIYGTISVSVSRRYLTYRLPVGTTLDASSNYQVGAVTLCDLANNQVAFAGSTFTTEAGPAEDTTNPYVSAILPADNATGVSLSPTISVTVTERLDRVSVSNETFYLRDDTAGVIVPTTVTLSADSLTVNIVPDAPLVSAHVYRIHAFASTDTGYRAKDLAGNILWFSSGSSYYGYLDDSNFTTQ